MKRIITSIVIAAAAVLSFTGCSLFYEESVDTIVNWGFAEKENTEVIYGLEQMLTSAQTLFDAFDDTFYKAGDRLVNEHEVCLRHQHGEKNAIKNAKKLAEEAAAKIPAGHTCSADYIFVVNIAYGSANPSKTVWSHDYRN